VSFDNYDNNNDKHAHAGVTDSFTHLRFLLVLTKCPLNCPVETNRESGADALAVWCVP
jgi:hypothetical protein